MFEKEAEEYLKAQCQKRKEEFVIRMPEVYIADIPQAFQDGAVFGYNKAKKEIKLLKETHRQSIDILVEQIEELHKANEWHYVKDGDLPINKNDCTTYLLYTIYGEGGSPVVAHFRGRDKQELMNIWTGAILTEDKIVAWKEIVIPKEIKENDRRTN